MSDLLDQANAIVARAQGDEQIEVFVSRGTDTEIRAYRGEIEELTTATSAGVGVRILRESEAGAQVGSAWAGALDEESIAQVVAEARDNLRFASEDEYVAFARPDGVAPAKLDLVDAGVEATPLDDKIQMAIELERMVRSGDARIRQVDSASYSDYVASAAIVSSLGISALSSRTGAYLSVEAIASDESGDQTGWGLSVGRAPADLELSQAANDAIRRATRMLGAVKAPSMKGVAVFDPRTAASLLSIIGSALSGFAVTRGRSFFAERVGEQVAAPMFTLVDDPTDPRHFSAATYDGEGLATRRNVLIENGRLLGFVYDTESARRAGTVSTGSASRGGLAGSPSASCRALVLAAGDKDQSEILASVGEGIFVESLTGVHSGVNPVSGDFSVGITGLMIRNGQLAEPIREVTVASTLQRMLLDILHVGNDVEWLPGTAAGQSLAIDGISLSGA
jgi:PmbA protein